MAQNQVAKNKIEQTNEDFRNTLQPSSLHQTIFKNKNEDNARVTPSICALYRQKKGQEVKKLTLTAKRN